MFHQEASVETIKFMVMMIINYVIYNITRWTFFIQQTHTADDAKAKHMSQVHENKWNNITKSCVIFKCMERDLKLN